MNVLEHLLCREEQIIILEMKTVVNINTVKTVEIILN